MNILITGANGFIGSNLTRLLVNEKHKVKAMVLKGTGIENLNGIDCEIVYADVTRPEMLKGMLDGIDLVYHLAAMASLAWTNVIFKVNYEGTRNLVNESITAGVRRFVFMSSLVVHGFRDFQKADENTPLLRPGPFTRPYIKSKIKCEEFLNSVKDKIETVVIRPGFNIFGPNDVQFTKEILGRLENKKLLGVVGNGMKKLGYVYVENLAYGLLCAGVSEKAPGNTYVIADSDPAYLHIREFFLTWCRKLNIRQKVTRAPAYVLMPVGFIIDMVHFTILRKIMPLLSTYTVNSSNHDLHFISVKAEKEIGYVQKVSFNDAIERTWEWYSKVSKKQE